MIDPINNSELHAKPDQSISLEEQLAIAHQLGIPHQDSDINSYKLIDKEKNKTAILNRWLINYRTEIIKEAAQRLNLPINNKQALAIGICFSVPEAALKGPLTPSEREIAIEIKYHALKSDADTNITSTELRERAEMFVQEKEIGKTDS